MTTPRKDTSLEHQLKEMQKKMAAQAQEIETLKRSYDFGTLFSNGVNAMEEALAPLRGISPVRKLTEEEESAILKLRASLEHPRYELLDGHFPPLDPKKPKRRETAA